MIAYMCIVFGFSIRALQCFSFEATVPFGLLCVSRNNKSFGLNKVFLC